MYELLLKKKQETEEKIRYEQQLLEKAHLHIRDISKSGIQSEASGSIKAFPASVILFESEKTSDFFPHSRLPI